MQVGSVKENYLYLKKYQSLDKAFKRGVMKLSSILMSLWNIIISLCFVQHLSQKKKMDDAHCTNCFKLLCKFAVNI